MLRNSGRNFFVQNFQNFAFFAAPFFAQRKFGQIFDVGDSVQFCEWEVIRFEAVDEKSRKIMDGTKRSEKTLKEPYPLNLGVSHNSIVSFLPDLLSRTVSEEVSELRNGEHRIFLNASRNL
uniref:Uncharacterized protein n=1 Tax=Romanomermis culicivorax TaxID=13658 RepID=A0A915JRW9_ROMCU